MQDPIFVIVALFAMALAPFVAVMTTSYTKLVVVFSLLRNALGIQQIPPNMVINGLAIILSMYIMAPLGYEIYDRIKANPDFNASDIKSISRIAEEVEQPLKQFLERYSSERDRKFLLTTIAKIWPDQNRQWQLNDYLILIPAFTISELTAAFKIGFLIYLPFVAIDIIISNLLMAMGMIMVSPMTISLPFKLLLFVLLEGWTKIIQGMILTYG